MMILLTKNKERDLQCNISINFNRPGRKSKSKSKEKVKRKDSFFQKIKGAFKNFQKKSEQVGEKLFQGIFKNESK